jgi:hypothetical protein
MDTLHLMYSKVYPTTLGQLHGNFLVMATQGIMDVAIKQM